MVYALLKSMDGHAPILEANPKPRYSEKEIWSKERAAQGIELRLFLKINLIY